MLDYQKIAETLKKNNDYTSKAAENFYLSAPDELLLEIAKFFDRQTRCNFALAAKRPASIIKKIRNQQINNPIKITAFTLRHDRPSCFWYTENHVYACGYNNYGQLGIENQKSISQFMQIPNLKGKIIDVIPHYLSVLILTSEGLYGAGLNDVGQLGLGELEQVNIFTLIPGLDGQILQVMPNYSSLFVLTSTGLYATGANSLGQLGLDPNEKINNFKKIENLPGKVLNIKSKGALHQTSTLALTSEGLYGTGDNQCNQLGLGSVRQVNAFTAINPAHFPSGDIIDVCPADSYNTFLLTTTGLYGVGNNLNGQLGLGNVDTVTHFTHINLPGKIQQIIPQCFFTFVHTSEGLFGTGSNSTGALGLGNIKETKIFTRIENFEGEIHKIYSTDYCTLLLTDKGLYGTGSNKYESNFTEKINPVKVFKLIEGYQGKIIDIFLANGIVLVITVQGIYGTESNSIEFEVNYTRDVITLTAIKNLRGQILQINSNKNYTYILTTEGLFQRRFYTSLDAPLIPDEVREQKFIEIEDRNLKQHLYLFRECNNLTKPKQKNNYLYLYEFNPAQATTLQQGKFLKRLKNDIDIITSINEIYSLYSHVAAAKKCADGSTIRTKTIKQEKKDNLHQKVKYKLTAVTKLFTKKSNNTATDETAPVYNQALSYLQNAITKLFPLAKNFDELKQAKEIMDVTGLHINHQRNFINHAAQITLDEIKSIINVKELATLTYQVIAYHTIFGAEKKSSRNGYSDSTICYANILFTIKDKLGELHSQVNRKDIVYHRPFIFDLKREIADCKSLFKQQTQIVEQAVQDLNLILDGNYVSRLSATQPTFSATSVPRR